MHYLTDSSSCLWLESVGILFALGETTQVLYQRTTEFAESLNSLDLGLGSGNIDITNEYTYEHGPRCSTDTTVIPNDNCGSWL